MIKLKGTTIYPPAINDVLDNTPYVVNYVVEVRNSFAGTDEVVVHVGVAAPQRFDMIKDLKDRFRSRIRVAPIVEIMQPDDVARMLNPGDNRKPLKFIDNRGKRG
jgi:phenylacetate-CoA ligase